MTRIAIQAWGEALRSPELEGRTRTFYLAVRSSLSELARRWRDEGTLASTADLEQVATVLMTLMPGLLIGRHLVTPVDADQRSAASPPSPWHSAALRARDHGGGRAHAGRGERLPGRPARWRRHASDGPFRQSHPCRVRP
ncbi:TetR family transcriptional regulator C-terminal domain-containing protein [Streptomyces sp. NBC_00212]|uniref:TetR family transcriptional regulator C-terminal domain-containing protein n=1 Tax=Streptomyces sp. NBC_00212 TaxID=2975684 RepID=UPI003864DD5A